MNTERDRSYILPACTFLATAAITLLVIFWDPLFSGLFIWGPDSSSFGHIQLRNSLPASYLGWWDNLSGLGAGSMARPLLPHNLITVLMPLLTIKVGICIGSILGAMLAAVYWFRGCGIKGWAVYVAAIAMGLSAHTFTLISAGHDGKTQSWPFCILLLAAVQRAFSRRTLFHFALAGYSAGVAFALQPDVALLFSFLALFYGLFLFLRHWPRRSSAAEQVPQAGLGGLRVRYVGRSALGAILAGALLFSISISSVMFALNVVLPDRAKIAATMGATGDTEQSKWEFSTNWSLPPDEILEFLAPCVYGIQTGDPKGPYWGSLGRSLSWDQHRQGLMNLRQHTVYLGVIPLVFALYAIVVAVRRRRRPVTTESGGRATGPADTSACLSEAGIDDHCRSSRRADTLFWSGAFLVSVLLAFGRYFPLYRVFYMIPYAANIRAPVKLLHLAEVSLCILFAFGMEAFLAGMAAKAVSSHSPERAKGKKATKQAISGAQADAGLWRFFGYGCAVVALLFLMGLAVVGARHDQLAETWAGMKLANYADVLTALMRGSLVHAAVLFFVCAAAFLVAAHTSSRLVGGALPFVMMVVVAVDLGSVDKRYIAVWDEYTRLTPRELIGRLGSDKADYRVALPVRGDIYDLWRQYIFPRNWITVLDAESPGTLTAEDQAFYRTLGNNPVREWRLTSTKNIFGPAASLAPLLGSPELDVVMHFNVMKDGSVQAVPAGRAQHVWLRLKTVLPRAAVYPPEYADGDSWTNRLADPGWDPARTVIVSGAPVAGAGNLGAVEPAEIVSFKPNRVEIVARSAAGGVLVLNDRYAPGWEAFLNGKAVELLRCNGVMRGVAVPTGESRVTFLYRPALVYFLASLAGVLVIVVWGTARLLLLRRSQSC
ncbi:MAG: YfhO family protein [bacterium]